jgi:hypothetical protein
MVMRMSVVMIVLIMLVIVVIKRFATAFLTHLNLSDADGPRIPFRLLSPFRS